MEQVLLVVQAILAVFLIGLVLLQRSESDGFGLGSGGGANLLSGRASANLMTRTTAIVAALFMANSLGLGLLAAHSRPDSIIETIQEQEAGSKAPAVPAADADEKAKPVAKDAAPEKKVQKPAVKPADAEPSQSDSNDSN